MELSKIYAKFNEALMLDAVRSAGSIVSWTKFEDYNRVEFTRINNYALIISKHPDNYDGSDQIDDSETLFEAMEENAGFPEIASAYATIIAGMFANDK